MFNLYIAVGALSTIVTQIASSAASFSVIRSISTSTATLPVANRNGYATYNYDVNPDCIFVFGGISGLYFVDQNCFLMEVQYIHILTYFLVTYLNRSQFHVLL